MVLVGLFVFVTTLPVNDVDVFWHAVIGRELRSGVPFTELGADWAWFQPADPWRTSQWASESMLSVLVDRFGWISSVALKSFAAGIIGASVALVVRSRLDAWPSAVLTLVTLFTLATFIEDRPNLVSMALTVWVGHSASLVLERSACPSWWWAPVAALWSNFHGGWVVLPAALTLATIARAVSDRIGGGGWWPRSSQVRSVSTLAVVTAAGCVNPLGIASLTLPFSFRSFTEHLTEWQPTTLWTGYGVGLAILFAVLATSWARSRPVPLHELAYSLPVAAAGLQVGRNIPIAALLLTPVVATAISRLVPIKSAPRVLGGERTALQWLLAGISVTFAGLTVLRLMGMNPLATSSPLDAAAVLPRTGGQVVLNEYNASGVLVEFGPPGTVLAVDGRADRFPPEYIEAHDDLVSMRPGWERSLDELDPDAAVLLTERPLVEGLRRLRNWTVVLVDDDYTVLRAPSAP